MKKAQTNSNRKNTSSVITSLKWYQDFARFVELQALAPRTRLSYLAWVRQLHAAFPRRHITKLKESEVLDFLIALRHERGLKDSTINQALCALRSLFRDHLGRDWEGWKSIKIRREEPLPNVLSREEVARFLASVREGRFWKAHRNPEWMFPATGRGWKSAGRTLGQAMGRSERPMSDASVQAAMRATVISLGWDKRHGRRHVTCHTLRKVCA